MVRSDWYEYGWSLDMKNQAWAEDTENEVNFIIKALKLTGTERILDLACGWGRHSLAFARRGFSVVGVDIIKAYIDDAIHSAEKRALNATFIQGNVRDIEYSEEFNVILGLGGGAIGFLENDAENLKIFDNAIRALKPGGKHFIDIFNADHAERYFPKKRWQAGNTALSLLQYEWDPDTRCMKYGRWHVLYGDVMERPNVNMDENLTRLYSLAELEKIYQQRGMEVIASYSDIYGKEATDKGLHLLVCSQKQGIGPVNIK